MCNGSYSVSMKPQGKSSQVNFWSNKIQPKTNTFTSSKSSKKKYQFKRWGRNFHDQHKKNSQKTRTYHTRITSSSRSAASKIAWSNSCSLEMDLSSMDTGDSSRNCKGLSWVQAPRSEVFSPVAETFWESGGNLVGKGSLLKPEPASLPAGRWGGVERSKGAWNLAKDFAVPRWRGKAFTISEGRRIGKQRERRDEEEIRGACGGGGRFDRAGGRLRRVPVGFHRRRVRASTSTLDFQKCKPFNETPFRC